MLWWFFVQSIVELVTKKTRNIYVEVVFLLFRLSKKTE